MCGICGYSGFNDPILLKKMTDAIIHRGPDDSGHFTDAKVGLGMRRLSIIDIESGRQPIHNEDETIWIVFNGEIYNFKELRVQLERKGHRFYTESDTEVIVHAYEEFGEECVKELRGMFAFAIWNKNEDKLFLARDRMGIKPLHYAIFDDKFFFASEIKSILQYKEYKPEIDLTALHDYLSYLYVPAPRSIFKGISKLLPAHTLTLKNGKINIKRYWDLTFPDSYNYNEDFYIKKTKELLEESVQMHMVSDVPLGVYLSGGLDSSTITGLMSKFSDRPVKTFTVGFLDEEYSELEYARDVSEHFGTEHYEHIVEYDAFKLLPDIVGQHDEPFGNSTSVIHYLISKEIGKHVKVAMSGGGGDEVFSGYPKYIAMRMAGYYSAVPSLIRKNLIERPFSLLSESGKEVDYVRWGRKLISTANQPPGMMYYNLISYFDEKEKLGLYSEKLSKLREIIKNPVDSSLFVTSFFSKAQNLNQDGRIFYTELNSFLPYNILEYTDKTSMAASIEARVPFLDHKLVEFAAMTPGNLKLKGFNMKYILKKAVKNLVPKKITNRKKMGFNPPTGLWIDRDLKDLMDEYLSEESIKNRNFFNYLEIKHLLQEHTLKKRNNGLKIWSLLFLEAWAREYLD